MKLYNTLTRKIDNLQQKEIKIYSCGPTVYNYIHIGNARSLITVDLLIHFLEFNHINVYHIQNFTDIDDKIINKAIEQNKNEREISEFYIKAFNEDVEVLKLRLPNKSIKISDHIPEIIEFIDNLVKKDAAYVVNGNVYFNINKYKNEYGKLSNKIINKLEVGIRIDLDNNKNNPLDFTLWKKTTIGITFYSPWGKGRPGWHTECVLLIDKFFKQQIIDIHTGGIDLIFPHHENERIQYWAKNNQEISKLWMYNGHLNLENKKMSKSLKNIITLREYSKQYGTNSLKFLLYSTNYSQPLNVTDKIIKHSVNEVNKISNLLKQLNIYLAKENLKLNLTNYGEYLIKANEQLANNLNTPNVLTILKELMKVINIRLKEKYVPIILINDFYNIIFKLLNFNFNLPIIRLEIIDLLNKLKTARKDNDFVQADKIRKELLKLDVL